MAKSYGGVRSSGGSSGTSAHDKIMSIITDIQKDGFSKQSPFAVGKVETDLKEYAAQHGIEIGNGQLYMSPKQIAHAMRDLHADKGIDISPQRLASFPELRSTMSLYHDTDKNKFVYFDGVVKYVVQPSYSLKLPNGKERVVNFITAYRANGREFTKRNFTKIR